MILDARRFFRSVVAPRTGRDGRSRRGSGDDRLRRQNAIGPALALYARVLAARWPVLLALAVGYAFVMAAAAMAWKAIPVSPAWMEIGLRAAKLLADAAVWGFIGAVLAQLTLATADRRPVEPTGVVAACASAFPIIAVTVLVMDVTSLPLTLRRIHLMTSGQLATQADPLAALTVPFAILDIVAFWLLAMAIPVRIDRELPVLETLKVSARLASRRWRTMLLIFFVTAILFMAMLLVTALARWPGDANAPAGGTDRYLVDASHRLIYFGWALFWPVLYVTFRDQEDAGAVAQTFD
jgi:hypothetical protein